MFGFCLFYKKYSSNTCNTVYSRIILPPRITLKSKQNTKKKNEICPLEVIPELPRHSQSEDPNFIGSRVPSAAILPCFPLEYFPKVVTKKMRKQANDPGLLPGS